MHVDVVFLILIFHSRICFKICRNDMMRDLESCGIPCTVILDSAVGYIMGQVDCVMVGAEGVVESGGIINKVSTLDIKVSSNLCH